MTDDYADLKATPEWGATLVEHEMTAMNPVPRAVNLKKKLPNAPLAGFFLQRFH